MVLKISNHQVINLWEAKVPLVAIGSYYNSVEEQRLFNCLMTLLLLNIDLIILNSLNYTIVISTHTTTSQPVLVSLIHGVMI